MVDSVFPSRLMGSSPQFVLEFIKLLFEDYSKRGLTVKTDRSVAISGLESRIARARRCHSRHGIFEDYLHRNLLWQRLGPEMIKRIAYDTESVPSWSWMAYDGGIQFMDIPFFGVDWNTALKFNGRYIPGLLRTAKDALVTDLGVFQNCDLKQRDTSCAILDANKAERGCILYDVEVNEDLHAQGCVVVGRQFSRYSFLPIETKYWILVVRSTGVDGDYKRIGVGWVQTDYVVRQRRNVRVV